MKRFKITWKGQVTGSHFTDLIEAESFNEALQYFRNMHTPHTEIVKVKASKVKSENSISFWFGVVFGAFGMIVAECLFILILSAFN